MSILEPGFSPSGLGNALTIVDSLTAVPLEAALALDVAWLSNGEVIVTHQPAARIVVRGSSVNGVSITVRVRPDASNLPLLPSGRVVRPVTR